MLELHVLLCPYKLVQAGRLFGVSLLIRFKLCIRARMVSRLRSRVCFSCVCTVRIHALNARSSGGSFGFIGEGGVTFALGS